MGLSHDVMAHHSDVKRPDALVVVPTASVLMMIPFDVVSRGLLFAVSNAQGWKGGTSTLGLRQIVSTLLPANAMFDDDLGICSTRSD